MPKAKKQTKKPAPKTVSVVGEIKRRIALAAKEQKPKTGHRAFRLTRERPPKRPQVLKFTSGWRLGRESLGIVKRWPRVLLGLAALYVVANWIFVGGASQLSYLASKEAINNYLGAGANGFLKIGSLFSLSVSGNLSQPANDLQRFMGGLILLLFWLIIIWAVRQLLADKPVKIRDALYSGPAALLSAMQVLLVITLQLLPAAIGIFTLSVVYAGGILAQGVEIMVFTAVAALLTMLSLYWVSGSVLGLMIVALPRMYPLRAIAAAKELTQGLRPQVLAAVLWLLIWLLIISVIVLLPLLIVDHIFNLNAIPLVPVAVQLLGGFFLLFSTVYVYKLYREIL